MSLPRRVAVVTSDVPFVFGGHRVIAEELAAALRRAGCASEVIRTPQNRFGRQLGAYLATWLTDVGETGDGHAVDQVISLRFPSYAVRHPRHVCWLNHRMREYYELWPRLAAQISIPGRAKELVRRTLIRAIDRVLLTRNVTRLFAQSRTIQQRLRRFGGIPSEVLYPPPPVRAYRTDAFEDFVFTVSRLDPLKRVDLLLRSLSRSRATGLRAVVAGTGPAEDSLRRLAAELGVAERVDFLGRIGEEALVERYARCRGVVFAPQDEDYGFVTMEAFRSRKPVLTCTDSGGPTELVAHGVSGFVTEPEPEALARSLETWAESPDLAARQGQKGDEATRSIAWPETVERLLCAPR